MSLEAGLNFFDTADVYSDGASESILGAATQRAARSGCDLHASSRCVAGPDANAVGASKYHPIRATDRALQRLGTDYIDLLQLHHFDAMTPVDGSDVRRSMTLVRAGKVRSIGASNFFGLAVDEVSGCRGSSWLLALRRQPGVLLAAGSRLRVGADATWASIKGIGAVVVSRWAGAD